MPRPVAVVSPLLLAALMALSAPALAGPGPDPADDDGDLRDIIRRQADRIEALERRLDAAGPPTEGSIDDAVKRYLEAREAAGTDLYTLAGVPRPANSRFRFGGYMSVLYRAADQDGKYSSFEGLRVVPQFAFDVSPGVEFATEIEFERGGADAGFLRGQEVLVEYAEVRFKVADAFVPRAGIVLIPFLRYNLYHDDPIWNLQDRPTTATRVFKAALQQPGIGSEGVIPLGDGGTTFNYNVALTNGMKDGVTNSSFSGARQDFREDINSNKTVWARVGLAPRIPFLDAADIGASYATGRMESSGATPRPGAVRMVGYGFDGKLTRGRFDLIFEWARFGYDRPASQPVATFPTQSHGGFVQVDTRLLEGLGSDRDGILGPSSTLTLAVRYEWNDLNARVHAASLEDDSRAWTVGLALRISPKTVIRVERRMERSAFPGRGSRDLAQWVVSLATYF